MVEEKLDKLIQLSQLLIKCQLLQIRLNPNSQYEHLEIHEIKQELLASHWPKGSYPYPHKSEVV